MNRIGLRIAALALVLLPVTGHADTWTKTILAKDGFLSGKPISDKAGNLYVSGDSVLKLTPPKTGQAGWTKTLIYSSDAGAVISLVMDVAGNLYGVTGATGLIAGTVFKLAPPGAGQTAWTRTVLHSFGSLHYGPSSGLTLDAAGNLYGAVVTTFEGYGHVYKLTRPSAGKTAWTETALAPAVNGGGVVFDKAGNLYGTDADTGLDQKPTCPGADCGSVFKLTPPADGKGAWKKAVLYRFTGGKNGAFPQSGLAMGAAGIIYGTTNAGGGTCPTGSAAGCGTIFKLAPPAAGKSAWTETVLYRFNPGSSQGPKPVGGVTIDRAGNLLGTTEASDAPNGRGTVYRLARPSKVNSAWTFSIASQFYGANPQGGLLVDPHGTVFGAADTANGSKGFVYQLTH